MLDMPDMQIKVSYAVPVDRELEFIVGLRENGIITSWVPDTANRKNANLEISYSIAI